MAAGILLDLHQLRFFRSLNNAPVSVGPIQVVQVTDTGDGPLPRPSIPSGDNPLATDPGIPVTAAPVTEIPSLPTYPSFPSPSPSLSIQGSQSQSGYATVTITAPHTTNSVLDSSQPTLLGSSLSSTTSLGGSNVTVYSSGTSFQVLSATESTSLSQSALSGLHATSLTIFSTVSTSSSSTSTSLKSSGSSSSLLSSTLSSTITSSMLLTSSSFSNSLLFSTPLSTSTPSAPTQGSSSTSLSLSSSVFSSSSVSGVSSSQAGSQTGAFVPAAKAANIDVHNPSFFVGIVFGIIAAIALLAALIAWWIRLQTHRRRKRAARTIVPWARSKDDDESTLESGRGGTGLTNVAAGAMNLGSLEDLADVHAWSDRGDRDVGEPKRSESFKYGSAYSLQNHAIPGYNLFPEESLKEIDSLSGSRSNLGHSHTFRQLSSHLITKDVYTQGNECDGNMYPNPYNFGARRKNDVPPRLSPGDRRPTWNRVAEEKSRLMVERLRQLGKPPAEPPWEILNSTGNLGHDEQPSPATWKSTLANAFNAVTSNISSSIVASKVENVDKLTAAPHTQRSIRNASPGKKRLYRNGSSSTVISKAWTLEETCNGAGIVHVLIPGVPTPPPPGISASTLSFFDGESISTLDDQSSTFQRMHLAESQVPLIASSKPQPALVRRNSSLARERSNETVNGQPVSRSSSIYSTVSWNHGRRIRHGIPELPRIASGCSFTMHDINNTRDDGRGLSDSIVIQPDSDAMSRLSSRASNSSCMARSDVGMADTLEALNKRQMRVADV